MPACFQSEQFCQPRAANDCSLITARYVDLGGFVPYISASAADQPSKISSQRHVESQHGNILSHRRQPRATKLEHTPHSPQCAGVAAAYRQYHWRFATLFHSTMQPLPFPLMAHADLTSVRVNSQIGVLTCRHSLHVHAPAVCAEKQGTYCQSKPRWSVYHLVTLSRTKVSLSRHSLPHLPFAGCATNLSLPIPRHSFFPFFMVS